MTLNLGLRYEWESGPYDDNDIFSRYLDLSTRRTTAMQKNPPQIPADLLALSTPKFNGAWVFTDSKNRKPFTTQKTIFLPRIGLAHSRQRQDGRQYRLRALRGAGRSPATARTAAPILSQPARGARDSTRHPLRCPSSKAGRRHICPILSRRFESSPVADRQEPRSVHQCRQPANWADQNYRAQINDRINFTIMREIPGQFKVDATWFMNIGRNVPHNDRS